MDFYKVREIDEQTETIYRFGQFEVDAANRTLLLEGRTIALTPKIFDMLLLFVVNNGRMLTKDEIMSAVWADTFVEETNLTSNISRLRKILHEGGADFIETLPKRGYRFKANIESGPEPDELIVTRRITAHIHQTTEETDSLPNAEIRPFWKRKPFVTAAATALLLIVGLSLMFSGYLQIPQAGSDRIKSLAIFPFKPLLAESRDEALELGMADTLIARLGNNREIVVRPLSSVRKYGGLEQDVMAAGRALGVDSILDGSIQRFGDKVRVNIRLIKTADGTSLWTETFDERFTDIFVVQDSIAKRVESALTLRLNGEEKTRLEKRYTNDPRAYELYLRGRFHYLKVTGPEIRKSIDFYRQAIEADPQYALAHAGMADAYRTLPIAYGASSKEGFPQAKAASLRALEIDPLLAEAHVTLGWVAFSYEWDWATAERELKLAIDLSPNNSEAHRAYAHFLSNQARHDEAIAEIKRARELDPIASLTSALYGQMLFYAGRDDEAFAIVNKLLEIDPNFWIAHNMLGRIYIRQQRYPEAIAVLNKAKKMSGGSTEPVTQLGYAQAKSGNRDQAIEILAELSSMAANQYVPAYNFAVVHNGLGEKDEALNYLEKSFEQREVQLMFMKIDTRWNELRNDPRFIELMKRMNFE
ncbi:MAG: tetratricopeptide repeat protein [Saprospiraceae bacterium]|nr:tetratricopeptide repeat protein [Pyrinomonadaceae bacterium]